MRLLFVLTILLFLPLLAFGQVCYPPTLTNAPDSIIESHCNDISFDFDGQKVALDNPANLLRFYSNIGDIDSLTGVWSYDPVIADYNNPLDLEIYLLSDTCAETTLVTLLVTNSAPVITNLPDDVLMTEYYPHTIDLDVIDSDLCDNIWWGGAWGSPGVYGDIDSLTGELTILSQFPDYGYIYFFVTDGIDTVYEEIDFYTMMIWPNQIFIEKEPTVYRGQILDIDISRHYASGSTMKSFSFSIAYNKIIQNLIQVIPSEFLLEDCGWEYFTYKLNLDTPNNDLGFVKVTMIANINENYESVNCFSPEGTEGVLFTLRFLISHDPKYECITYPIQFYWESGNDNFVYELGDGKKLTSSYIFNEEAILNPIFSNDISNPNVGYPTTLGQQNIDCCDNPSNIYYQGLQLFNGSIDLVCTDSIADYGGDINLDNMRYTVSDLSLYANYFIYGISVFNINTEGQIAASDVNGDGLTLSIMDLEYYIRIILGDNLIYPKTTPVTTNLTNTSGTIAVSDPMGAAHIITKGECTPQLLAENMQMQYHYDSESDITRILVYNMTELNQTFAGDFINIGNASIESIDLTTYHGAPVITKLIPKQFTLYQNFPNPFNPTTTIKFAIPQSGEATLEIYNINGQLVQTINRNYDSPGEYEIKWDATGLSSGIYIYKLSHSNSTHSKKMILLK